MAMACPLPATFQKSARLRAAPEFQAVFKAGLKSSGVFFRLYVLQRPDEPVSRLGLAVPKKAVPLAHNRNRIKRLCREIFRQHGPASPGDYVLVAQSRARDAKNAALVSELQRLFCTLNTPPSL